MARNIENETQKIESARRWINGNPAQVMVVCVGCVLLLMTVLRSQQTSTPNPPTHQWFYDTVTGQLVPERYGAIPPLAAGEGEMWLARVYACGDCADSFIAWFEKMAPKAKRRLDELHALAAEGPLTRDQESEMYDLAMTGWLYSIDGQQWQPKDMVAEEELMLLVESRCSGTAARFCLPGPHDLR